MCSGRWSTAGASLGSPHGGRGVVCYARTSCSRAGQPEGTLCASCGRAELRVQFGTGMCLLSPSPAPSMEPQPYLLGTAIGQPLLTVPVEATGAPAVKGDIKPSRLGCRAAME